MKPSIKFASRSRPQAHQLRFRKHGVLQPLEVLKPSYKAQIVEQLYARKEHDRRDVVYATPPPRVRTENLTLRNQQKRAAAGNVHRDRLSLFWAPTGRLEQHESSQHESTAALLARAGFVYPTHAGIFQLLPLGQRVQQKLVNLLDRHMENLGAAKLALSTFSSEALWERSGRLSNDTAEFFRFKDRRGTKFLLSPTHEEEITSLVGNAVTSYRSLPLRLYQITRKYRDERRARAGLLRTREFLMKDLYTFDTDETAALETYQQVCSTYAAFFDELKIPYYVANAHSGSIGGDLSHEYHIMSPSGEDDLVICSECSFAANTETLANFEAPDRCPNCKSISLSSNKAIELGHAFNLGTKYSSALNAEVDNRDGVRVPMQMGCFGIGVSRMIAAIADLMRDRRGLNWPRSMAPFEAVIIPASDRLDHIAGYAYDKLRHLGNKRARSDPILDDRDIPLTWKLKDADLIGYPIVVIVGKAWKEQRLLEVQCRRLNATLKVGLADLKQHVGRLLSQL